MSPYRTASTAAVLALWLVAVAAAGDAGVEPAPDARLVPEGERDADGNGRPVAPPLELQALPDDPEPGLPPMQPLELLGEHVLPGTRAILRWSASQDFAGGDAQVPVLVARGARPGPTLCLTAGVHGDEVNGVEIVRRVANGIVASDLSGTVIGVPVVNLFGYQRNLRYLPDRRDLNRFFPGSRGGSVASRIAHSFFENVVRHCELLIDFHTGSFDRSNLPQVRSDLRDPDVLEFTRAFGSTVVLHSRGSSGMLRHAATRAGIPAVTFEVGAPVRLEPRKIDVAVESVRKLLANLGMLDLALDEQEPQPIFLVSRWVRADTGGLLISEVELGDLVRAGQQLGRVVDPLRNVEDEILSPVDGRVIGQAQNQQVLPGFAVYHLGEVTSEARAVEDAAAGRNEAPPSEEGDGAMTLEDFDPEEDLD